MERLGIRKIVYSIENGLISCKLAEIRPQKISLGRLYIEKGYKIEHEVHRTEKVYLKLT